jgi:hypothetical protein
VRRQAGQAHTQQREQRPALCAGKFFGAYGRRNAPGGFGGNFGGGEQAMQSEMPAPGSYEPFRLKEKIGEMMKYGRPLTKNFSRKDRDLADDMRVSMLKMYHLAVELEKKYYRKTTAQELDVELEWLRNLVRMAADKDLCGAKFAPPLSMHQYETWARYNTEIGCLLGKYIASVKK